MLENVKNKYLEFEMEVALRIGESTKTVRYGFGAVGVAVVVALGVLGYAVA